MLRNYRTALTNWRDWKGWKFTVNFHSMSLPIFNGDFLRRFFKIQSTTSHLNGHNFSVPIVSSHQFHVNSMPNGERIKKEKFCRWKHTQKYNFQFHWFLFACLCVPYTTQSFSKRSAVVSCIRVLLSNDNTCKHI